MPFLLAISVGNTRTAVGHFHGDELHVVQHLANGDVGAIVAAACEQWEHKGDEDGEGVEAGGDPEGDQRKGGGTEIERGGAPARGQAPDERLLEDPVEVFGGGLV
jgi:hypothetical protein